VPWATASWPVGGNYKYKEFATRGHDAWYPAWSEADYFPFYSRAHKANPWPLYGRTEFCQGTAFTDTLGVSPGFDGYEWRRKRGADPRCHFQHAWWQQPFGTYDCRIRRGTPVVAVVAAPGGDFSQSTHGAAHHYDEHTGQPGDSCA
jgi:hypothetical protein